jgi:hypothetical protein
MTYQSIPDSHDFRGVLEDDDSMTFPSAFNRTSQSPESSSHDNDLQTCRLADKWISFWFRHFLKAIVMSFGGWCLWRALSSAVTAAGVEGIADNCRVEDCRELRGNQSEAVRPRNLRGGRTDAE